MRRLPVGHPPYKHGGGRCKSQFSHSICQYRSDFGLRKTRHPVEYRLIYTNEVCNFDASDIFDIDLAHFRVGVGGIFPDDRFDGPAHDFAENSDGAASAVLLHVSGYSRVEVGILTLPWLQWSKRG